MAGGRDLRPYVDRYGHIAVDVEIGGPPGTDSRGRPLESRTTGASAEPATIARFLRDLADDVERADADPDAEVTG